MKLSRQAEVKEETLVKAHDPEAFLTQVADTLQASLLRSGKVRAELFSGQPIVVTGTTTRTKRDADHATLVEVTLDIQTLRRNRIMSSNCPFAVEDKDTKIIIESDGSVIIGDCFGHFTGKITPSEFDALANARREWMQANHQEDALGEPVPSTTEMREYGDKTMGPIRTLTSNQVQAKLR